MKILLIVLLTLSTNLFSWVTSTPDIKNNNHTQNSKNYLWLNRNKDIDLTVLMGGDSKAFFTQNDLSRYLKLKMRGLISKLNIEKKIKIKDHSKMLLEVELYEYNDNLGVYYGLISYGLNPSIYTKLKPKDYKITIAIAGNERQIVNLVKANIDSIIEKFAEDYFYIEDLAKREGK